MRTLFVVAFAATLSACPVEQPAEEEPRCLSNETQICQCFGGTGVQTCDQQGEWMTCECPGQAGDATPQGEPDSALPNDPDPDRALPDDPADAGDPQPVGCLDCACGPDDACDDGLFCDENGTCTLDGPSLPAVVVSGSAERRPPGAVVCNTSTPRTRVPWVSQKLSSIGTWDQNMCCGPAALTMAKGFFDGRERLGDADLIATIDWMDENIAGWDGRDYRCHRGGTSEAQVVETAEGYLGAQGAALSMGWCDLLNELDGTQVVIIHSHSQGGNNTGVLSLEGSSHWLILEGVDGDRAYVTDPGRTNAAQGHRRTFTTESVRRSYEAQEQLAVIIAPTDEPQPMECRQPSTGTIVTPQAGQRVCGVFDVEGSFEDLDGVDLASLTIDVNPACRFPQPYPGRPNRSDFSIAVGLGGECDLAPGPHTLGLWVRDGCDNAERVDTVEIFVSCPETCNGRDDDGDGRIDIGATCPGDQECQQGVCVDGGCRNGETRPCEGGSDIGECSRGTQRCVDRNWGACENRVEPAAETCDGQDDDCDGTNDDGAPCAEGLECIGGACLPCRNDATRACGSNTGECTAGTQTCANNAWGACVGEVRPVAEACNQLDDDCDARTDEGACAAPVCCSLTSDPPVDQWQADFVPDVDCACAAGNRDCHSLWRGRVDDIEGNRATMTFQGVNGNGPSVDVTYWIVVMAENQTSCLDINAYVARTQGIWRANQPLTVTVDVWPNEDSCEGAAANSVYHVALISGGRGFENQRIWFQKFPFTFTKQACR